MKRENTRKRCKTIIGLLCGLWALGLGSRFTLELLASDGWIHVPKHPVNIWFDFVPLCMFGLFMVILETKEMVKSINKSAAIADKNSRKTLDEIVTELKRRRSGSLYPPVCKNIN